MSRDQKKICIVCTSLDHGGAERASAMQSIIFNNLGYKVFIVTVKSGVAYKFKGEVFDLGAYKRETNSSLSRIFRLMKLRTFLNNYKFDFIVDNRPRNQAYREFLISKFIYKVPSIYVLHSFEASLAFTKYEWLNRYLYGNQSMVCVSKKGAKKFQELYGLKKIKTIYNTFDFKEITAESNKESSNLISDDYIISYGRIHDKSKNLKLLIEAYSKSKLKDYKIKLLLMGDGEDVSLIKALIKKLQIENHIVISGFESNPFPYVKNAMFSVLTSRSEGFAMVIPESMCLGTPVVSVNCDAGPKEIISHEKNGLLIENHNPVALANAFNLFVENKELYMYCKQNTKKSVEKFSIERITEKWRALFE